MMPARAGRGGGGGGGRGARLAAPLVAALAITAMALHAEAAIRWTSTGMLEAQVLPADVHFEMGTGGAKTRYFHDFALSANETQFSGTLKAKAGADTSVRDVLAIHNDGLAPRDLTLRASRVGNAQFEVFTWTIRDGSTTVATFDYIAGSPSAAFTLAPGAFYALDLRVDLADGAGMHNAGVAFDLWLEVA
jgi:hypothetical protein